MDEDLAEAISRDFYKAYVNWTEDTNAGTNKKVFFTVNWILVFVKARQWVDMWQEYLGTSATPKDLVDAINNKKLKRATKLGDQINNKFGLV